MNIPQDAIRITVIGIGATVFMDLWLILLGRLGVSTQSFALIGRWVGHFLRGRMTHAAISKSEPIAGELTLGWLTHYSVGIAFSGFLAVIAGHTWIASPTLVPALAVGAFTVAVPLLVMQPAMGAGLLASKTPTPLKNCMRSLANHCVFGLGLYLTAALIALVAA